MQAEIEAMLRQKIGLDADSIGSRTIARAVERCRSRCGAPNLASYWQRLKTTPSEVEALIEAVVVPETWFFRDREPFVCLSQFVKTEWKRNGVFRVLSVPCSTGEEPYSIAVTLLESGLMATQFRIDAVDISQQALQKAKRAVYTKKSFRGGAVNLRYFQNHENGYEVRSFVRETVHFRQGNILEPAFLAKQQYHVIFCRNLLIYLNHSARNQVLETLDRVLMPSGLLFVGSAETSQISAKHYKSRRHASAFAYQKESPPLIQPKPLQIVSISKKTPPKSAQFSKTSAPKQSPLEQAKQLADRGQLVEAANLTEAYLDADRANPRAYLLLGEIYQELNDLDRAERSFQKAIYLNPNFYEALIHLALLKEERGDMTTAAILRSRIQRLLQS